MKTWCISGKGVLQQKGIKQASHKTSGPYDKGHMYLVHNIWLWSETLQNFSCPTLFVWPFLPPSQSQNSHVCHVIVSHSTTTKREESKDTLPNFYIFSSALPHKMSGLYITWNNANLSSKIWMVTVSVVLKNRKLRCLLVA